MMKQVKIAALALAVAATMASCNDKARLAKEIEGVWNGNPERIADTTAAGSTMIRTFEFQTDDTGEGGTVIITALIDMQNSITSPAAHSSIQPIEVSAAATASVTGSWRAVDDDDIIITLDPQSTQINIDPDAVKLDYNMLTDDSAPDLETLKPSASAIIGRQVNAAVTDNMLSVNKIDDIKVHGGNMLECEINDRDITLRRRP